MLMRVFIAAGLAIALLLGAQQGFSKEAPAALPGKMVRPGAPGPTQVSIGIWIADLSRIDSAEQTFAANLVVGINWRDASLAHGEPVAVRYNLADIWHPNWLIANATTSLQSTFPEVAQVARDGLVTYRQRLIGTFSQQLDLRKFPFDSAIFRIHFVAVGQTPAELQFVANEAMVAEGMPSGAGIDRHLTLQDWTISDVSTRVLPYQDVPGFTLAGYAVEFKATRLVQHYIAKVIIPLLLIVVMSWAAFWLEPSMGSTKASIAVTSMLTLIAYRSAVGVETPRLPYLTDLDAFILVSSILVLLTLVVVIVTTTLGSHGQAALARKIDRYCRFAFPAAYVAVSAVTLFLR